MTLTDDLEIQGQTFFNLSIHNKTCNYDAELILVSILTFLRFRDLKKAKINHLTLTVDLQNQGHKCILV